MTQHQSIQGNRAVENAALSYVTTHEQSRGRAAHDTRGTGAAGDLVSAERVIEVKAYGGSSRGQNLWLEVRQVEEARANPDFWLYIVENIRQGDPTQFRLLTFGGGDLAALVSRAKERRYFEIPFPVQIYDQHVSQRPPA